MLLLEARTTGRFFSFGGGVQSVAVLVLQAQGRVAPYDAFVFANVGEDSENPATLRYLREVIKPFAQAHGIPLVETQKRLRDGSLDTLWRMCFRTRRSIPVPARMGGNGAPGNRSCTANFKIEVVDRWIRVQQYPRAVIGLGITVDEYHRARDQQWHAGYGTRRFGFLKRREYPLITLRMSRADCKRVIAGAGLPIPPRSACFFCPYQKPSEWVAMRRDQPALFARAVALEKHLNAKRGLLGRDRVFFHPALVPLDQAVGTQPLLPGFEMDMCESGYCFV